MIDFSGPNKNRNRLAFITLFICINLAAILALKPRYPDKTLAQTHRYDAIADGALCKRHPTDHKLSNGSSYIFDLIIKVDNHIFTALNVPFNKCQQIETLMKTPFETSIWHHNMLIYQLGKEGKLLPYQQQTISIRESIDATSQSQLLYYFMLFLLWASIHRTIVNALIPGTFAKLGS